MSRRPYMRAMSASEWVFRHPRYVRYMLRELSCVFIGAWTLMAVWGLGQLAQGPAAWSSFLESLTSPASVVFHALALAFSLYHSVTWFNLTPKAIPLPFVSAAHYGGWVALSIALFWLAGVF